jgi:surface protein
MPDFQVLKSLMFSDVLSQMRARRTRDTIDGQNRVSSRTLIHNHRSVSNPTAVTRNRKENDEFEALNTHIEIINNIMEEERPSKRQMKTPEDERTTTTASVAKNTNDFTNIMDLLHSLPANIVATYIYPFAVKVIQNHEELIEAVDEYLDEFYDNGEEKNDDEDVGNNQIRYPIGDWDVSRVNDFTGVFDHTRNRKARHFNEDLSRWNVANGTSFARMFLGCRVFQSDLSRWHVTKATNLSFMFSECVSFNSDVSRWNTANATNLRYMLYHCTSFNSDVSDWNVANATDLSFMFSECVSFNSNVSRWNTANATNLCSMFGNCPNFKSDVSDWNVANATDLGSMFRNCTGFDSDVSRWNVANATGLGLMFNGCKSFNSDVSRWNTANATNLSGMFAVCTIFNSDVSQWDLPSATGDWAFLHNVTRSIATLWRPGHCGTSGVWLIYFSANVDTSILLP